MPPVPATNSATTAPTKARPDEMRSPARKNGSAPGMRSRQRVAKRPALFMRKYASSPGSTLRRPMVVLEMIGKMAMTVAQRVSAVGVSLMRMMISGATATMGVTCSRTA